MTKHEPFIMLPHAVYDSPVFAALAPVHVAILLLLIRKHNGHNNGSIALGVREAEKRCHCGRATACRVLKRLQTDGLITATYKGHLVPEIGRPYIATRWRLNFLEGKTLPRPTREPSGRFSSETSLTDSVRFSSETSPRVPPENQYKDNLTAEAEAEAMPAAMDVPGPVAAASPRRPEPTALGGFRRQTSQFASPSPTAGRVTSHDRRRHQS